VQTLFLPQLLNAAAASGAAFEEVKKAIAVFCTCLRMAALERFGL